MKAANKILPYTGCGAGVPDIDGPVHGYPDASPGCWDLYGPVLAKKYGRTATPRSTA